MLLVRVKGIAKAMAMACIPKDLDKAFDKSIRDSPLFVIKPSAIISLEATSYGINSTIEMIATLRLKTNPMLKDTALNAEATPLLLKGTDDIIELVLGAIKSPAPKPNNISHNITKFKLDSGAIVDSP